MASWNNSSGMPNWQGNRTQLGNIRAKNIYADLVVADKLSSITLDTTSISSYNIQTYNLKSYNNYLDYIDNINIITNVITLDSNALTASNGSLYINGVLVATPGDVDISQWAQYPAIANIDANYSTIKNALGISSIYLSTSLIDCDSIKAIGARIDTLFGFDQINYPFGKVDIIQNEALGTSSITTSTIRSKLIYNEFEVSTYSVYADLGVYQQLNASNITAGFIDANRISASNDLRCANMSSLFVSTGFIEGDSSYFNNSVVSTLVVQYLASIDTLVVNKNTLTSNLRANYISTNRLSTNTLIGQEGYFSTLYVDNLFSKNLSSISTTNITASSINANGGVFDNLYANNIYNTSNINTSNLNASSNTTLQNLTTNGPITFNNNLAMNGNITFPTNNVISPEYPGGLAQFQKDIYSVRFVNAECINILGGSTGNEFFPPYRNDSIINVGEDLVSPGQVIINGFNPDPLDSGIALTCRGDAQVEQNLNVLGEFNTTGLATFEGDVNIIGNTSADGNLDVNGALEVVGITNLLGDTNIAGVATVSGAANLLGGVAVEAGIGIVGAMGLTGGNVVFGSGIDTSHTFTSFYYTNIKNNMKVDSNILTNSLQALGLSTNSLNVQTNVDKEGTITFSDLNNNIFASIGDAGGNQLYMAGLSNMVIESFDSLSLVATTNNNILSGEKINLLTPKEVNIIASTTTIRSDLISLEASQGVAVSTILLAPLMYLSTLEASNTKTNKLYVDDIYSNGSGISIRDTVLMNGYSINNVDTVSLNNLSNEAFVSVLCDLDMVNSNITNVNQLDVRSISSINLQSSNILASNIFTSGTNSNLNYVSTHALRCSLLLPNPGQGGVINTCNIYPLNTGNQIGYGGAGLGAWNRIWSRNFQGGGYFGETLDINSTVKLQYHATASSITVSTILGVQTLSTINTGGITTNNLQAQRIVSRGGSLLQIGSFEPTTGAGIGYFTPGNGGGRYSVFHAFSTFTNVIIPTTSNGFRASTVFVQANLSTFHTETSSITSRNAFTSNITASNVITSLITGNPNLELRGNLQSRLGDVIFGSNTETTRNFVSHYNTIFSNTTTFNNTATFNCNANFNSNITSLFGDITFGSSSNTNKNFVSYYNTIFNNTVYAQDTTVYVSNTTIQGDATTNVKSGNGYFNNIYGLDNGFVKFREYIDMSDNAILNGSLYYASTMVVAPTNGEVNGLLSNYIGAGVVFQGKPGDSNFWQLSKPDFDLSGTVAPDLPGSEGVYIIKRSGDDGNQLAMGRLYDNNVYTPWANVTGDLNMVLYNILFKDQATSIEFGLNFSNNFLHYYQVGVSGNRYVAQDWPFFAAEHYVDMSYNDIKNINSTITKYLDVSNNFTYRNIVQPIIQCGSDNTGSAGVTVTLPVEYPTSNYCVQLTYHNNPAGNKPLYHDSITTSNFFVDGDANADFDWTTFWTP